jgi:NMD protein affecting ribosome stability and mRNA decay
MEANDKGKQKVNTCFNCGQVCYSTEHHVKELGKEYTMELCQNCHTSLNHYQEEALPKLKKFIESND